MLYILLSWILQFIVTCSIGSAVNALIGSRFASFRNPTQFDLFELFWLGCAVTILFSQIISIWLPLGVLSFAVWIASGAIGLSLLLPRILNGIRERIHAKQVRKSLAFILICVAGCLIAAYRLSVSEVIGHDTNLYHFSWLRWANEYPAVPGLANLHSRLAMNSGFLLFAALTDNAWWDGQSAWIVAGLFIVFAFCRLVWIALASRENVSFDARLFAIIVLPYSIASITHIIPDLSYDTPTLLIQILLVQECILRKNALLNGTPKDSTNQLGFLFLLATLGFVFKPIGLITLLLVALFAIYRIIQADRAFRNAVSRLASISLLPALLVSGHVFRNAILSGWPLFPIPVLKLNFNWTLPAFPTGDSHADELQSAHGLYQVIKAWAKTPSIEYKQTISEGFAYWFPVWSSKFVDSLEFKMLLISIILTLIYLARGTLRFSKTKDALFDLFLLSIGFLNLILWFVSAPDLRFGDGFFWICLALSAVLATRSFKINERYKIIGSTVALAMPLAMLSIEAMPLTAPSLWKIPTAQPWPTNNIRIDARPSPSFTVGVPVHSNLCGDAPLPCTPYPLSSLRMRKAGSLRHGFRSENASTPSGHPSQGMDSKIRGLTELNFTSGWNDRESIDADYWQWSSGDGVINCEVRGPESLAVRFEFQLRAISSRTISIKLNGKAIRPLAYEAPQMTPIIEVPLLLRPGKNIIELSTNLPPDLLENDSRALAFALYNFRLRLDTSGD